MSVDTRTPAEIRYDALKNGSAYIKPQPAEDAKLAIARDIDRVLDAKLGTAEDDDDADYNPWEDIIKVLLGIDQQVAAAGPCNDIFDRKVAVLGTLPNGATITRPTTDAAPAGWVNVKLGDIDIDIDASGEIVGVDVGGQYLDDIPTSEWIALAKLLSTLDLARLGEIATLPPAVNDAINAWHDLPNKDMKHIARTIGFAEWMKRRQA
jgi:hypothetical protein